MKTQHIHKEDLPNYVNLNLFSNRFAIALFDYKRTGNKPKHLNEVCDTFTEILNKFMNWSIEPKYSSFVNNLLDTEEEHEFLREILGNKPYEEARNLLAKTVDLKLSEILTEPRNKSIDYMIDSITRLSNKSILVYTNRPLV
ncbi:MAG: hypothetical protein V1886_04435 [archaeon]